MKKEQVKRNPQTCQHQSVKDVEGNLDGVAKKKATWDRKKSYPKKRRSTKNVLVINLPAVFK